MTDIEDIKRFINDFKSKNTSNELVKLCMDQGWVYKNNFYDSCFGERISCFYYPKRIYVQYYEMEYKHLPILLPLPKRLQKKLYLSRISVPSALKLDEVTSIGNNLHLSDDEIRSTLCIGNLRGKPINNLWKIKDMCAISDSIDGIDDELDAWFDDIESNLYNSIKHPDKTSYSDDVISARKIIMPMLSNSNTRTVFSVY